MTVPGPWLFAVLTLAAWRTWVLINRDTILDDVRDRLAPEDTWRRELIDCPYCTGWWVAGAATAVWAASSGWPGVAGFAATWLALSAAVALLEHVADVLTETLLR